MNTKIIVLEKENRPKRSDLVAYFVFQGAALLNLPLAAANLSALAKQEDFEGKKDQTLLNLNGDKAHPRQLVFGLGKVADFDLEALRRAACRAARQARDLKVKEALFVLPAEEPKGSSFAELAGALAEGIWLGLYKYRQFISKPDEKKDPQLINLLPWQVKSSAALKAAVQRAEALCQSVVFVRDLVNCPPSHLVPEDFAKQAAKAIATAKNIRLQTFHKDRITAMKMGGLLGVSRGSDKPPVFLHLHYKPTGKIRRSVAVVGKGITFDSGGLSLKPANSMEDMKCDMAGAASVLGIVLAASRLNLPVELHGLCAVTENMPGPGALKPGDVLTAMNGKTMEVLNTDAEGRLVLADALSYGVKLEPDLMIDMATLTGAAIVALGQEITAVLGDQKIVDGLKAAGEKTGEKMWQLPLVPEYKEHIKSRIADMKNIGRPGQAGTIIGGLFLQEFVGDTPWVHMDIAGPAFLSSEAGYQPQGATGIPVRTLVRFLESL